MLTEARDLAAELGDVEIARRGDGLAGADVRRPLRPRARRGREVGALREMAERTAQPFMIHVAEHYGSALALCDGRARRGRGDGARARASGGSLLTGRDASGTYGIQMFGIRREQGRLAELAPAVRILAGDADRDGPWRPGLAARAGRARDGGRGAARARAARGRGHRRAARLALAGGAHLPRPTPAAALGDEAMAALLYPELEPLAGAQRDDRPPASPATAPPTATSGCSRRRSARRERAEEHFERALALNRRDGRADLGRPHRLRVRALPARPRRADAARAAALLAEAARARRADRAGRRCSARVRALGARRRRRWPLPGRALPARGADPRAGRPRAQQPRDRRRARRSASTPPPTTSAASCARPSRANRTEAASFAHRHGLASAWPSRALGSTDGRST